MSNGEPSPLVEALPPNTDYMTYLTIVEATLQKEDLEEFYEILQDEKLTSNLGWDLVRILLPKMPESRNCLKTVARLGNPREVLLKVAEALRENLNKDQHFDEYLRSVEETSETGFRESPYSQSAVLVYMLIALHTRIKTKSPSRFLSTSLRAILVAASNSNLDLEALDYCLKFTKRFYGRTFDNADPESTQSPTTAPDPEATFIDVSEEDRGVQRKLLQSFLTHLLEENLEYLVPNEHNLGINPGFCWSMRLHEYFQPEKLIPGRKTTSKRYAEGEFPRPADRKRFWADVEDTSSSVGLTIATLKDAVLSLKTDDSGGSMYDEELEPPSSPDDIGLSHTGSLLLLASEMFRFFSRNANGDADKSLAHGIRIFPEHDLFLKNTLGLDTRGGVETTGMEHTFLLDSALVPAVIAINTGNIGQATTDDEFKGYMQRITLIAYSCRSEEIRAVAHSVATAVLRSHPSDKVRLEYLKDTLEYCPFVTLKEVAIGWLKDEIVDGVKNRTQNGAAEENSIFANPIGLEAVSVAVFPDVSLMLNGPDLDEQLSSFHENVGFLMAGLNFYYYLISSANVRSALGIPSFHSNNDIGGTYLGPLHTACIDLLQAIEAGTLLGGEHPLEKGPSISHLQLALAKTEQVMEAVAALATA